ncbi:hypothetical protein [Haloferula sp. BvORR071]|uniref:hypothetical protein n=1 Tax=Haloferula sp. BvORR071 TaxID=1396141 RepID=UPI0005514E31|nr:hypothetical protein [Haloferula sp. BvORR071]
MTGKKTVKNLVSYLAPFFEEPVVPFDSNEKRELPFISVGYDNDNQTETIPGNYTVSGFVCIGVNGYDDGGNTLADSLADEVIDLLCDRAALEAAMNAPAGEDERPAKGFHLIRLYVRGTEREEQDSSTFVFVRFDAFTCAFDSVAG